MIFLVAGILPLLFGIVAIFAAKMPQDEIAHPLDRLTCPPTPPPLPLVTRPAWSWASRSRRCWCASPRRRSSCVRLPWLGWVLLAAGLVGCLARRASGCRDPRREHVGRAGDARPDGIRHPSLVRDLSLIAVGLLIVSAIPLAAELDDLAFVRFGLALGGAVAVPYVMSRWVYRDRAIRFPWRGGGRWTTFQWTWLVAVLLPRLADPAVLLHHHRRVPELAGGRHARA